jgi:hypothetical protein
MHICFKIIKFLLYSTLLYMFRILLCPSSGAFHHCTCNLWLPCGVVLVASSSWRTHTTVSIIRSLPPLHTQPLVTMRCCVGCVLQLEDAHYCVHHQEPKTAQAASGFAYVEGCQTCCCWTLSGSIRYLKTSNNNTYANPEAGFAALGS